MKGFIQRKNEEEQYEREYVNGYQRNKELPRQLNFAIYSFHLYVRAERSDMRKAIAVHEVGTYKTDCNCGKRYQRTYKEGIAHLNACDKATTLYFCGHYQKPQLVAEKKKI